MVGDEIGKAGKGQPPGNLPEEPGLNRGWEAFKGLLAGERLGVSFRQPLQQLRRTDLRKRTAFLELSSKTIPIIYSCDKGLNKKVLIGKEKKLTPEVFSKLIRQNLVIN